MTPAARKQTQRRRLVTGMLSLSLHGAVLGALLLAQPGAPPTFEPPAIQVQLVELPPPPPPAPPAPAPKPDPAPPKPAPPKVEKTPKPAPPKRTIARPVSKPPPTAKPIVAESGKVTDLAAEVSDAELASAAKAGAGSGAGGGGQCDMAGWLQAKLRSDRRVQAAITQAQKGRAIRVWNGDWITHPGQEGKGLAAVREAIMWEVAFAPEACRRQRVRGLVLLALNDQPGGGRVVLGAGDWRWSDVLWAADSPRRRG